jgi:hypothetical protein
MPCVVRGQALRGPALLLAPTQPRSGRVSPQAPRVVRGGQPEERLVPARELIQRRAMPGA